MTDLTLTALYRYPVKSLRGEKFASLEVGPRGLRFDRHWMVVDAQRRFLTQRQQPRMSLISSRVDSAGTLHLQATGMPDIEVRVADGARAPVRVWNDTLDAVDAGPQVAAWLGEFLGLDCRLVRFAADVVRPVDPDFADSSDQVGFADGFPFLLITQASLDDLNARLAQSVPMLRFRPNLVVSGTEPFAEDHWHRIRVGDLTFRVAKPCSRCIIPTIDPATARRGSEPLRTLMTYRRRDNKVYFGQNLVHDATGRLAVGMPVEILE